MGNLPRLKPSRARAHASPRRGARKLHCWAAEGILSPKTGQRGILETIKIRAERHTSLEAFARFCQGISGLQRPA